MSNTIVTVKYSNGSTREFIASDALEALINEGEMFSITTMHSDMGQVEELAVSKMYAGNPVAAMGHMMMMKRNAEKMMNDDDNTDDMEIVIQTLNACIQLLSDEMTSHQSGMVDITQMGADKPEVEKFFCGNEHVDENKCSHSCNLDNPCVKDEKCEGFMPF